MQQKLLAQCPDKAFFRQKISKTFQPQNGKIHEQLKGLLRLKQEMSACRLAADSVYLYLLQKIGTLHFYSSDYDSAIYYTHASNAVARNKYLTDTSYSSALMNNYYNLFYYYNLKGDKEKEMESLDNWIALFLKGNYEYKSGIAVLTYKVDYLFNKGEYSLANQFAKLGEAIVLKFDDSESRVGSLLYFMMKQANSLYYAKDYAGSKRILENAVSRFQQGENRHELGPFYLLMGSIAVKEGRVIQALELFLKGYDYNYVIGFNEGCAQSLYCAGSVMGLYLGRFKEGLEYCLQSLKFAGADDSLMAFKETGTLYAHEKKFDSAQYFFQKAFNTIRKGCNEQDLLKDSFRFPGFNQLQDLVDLTISKGNAFLLQYKTTGDRAYLKKALDVYRKNDFFLSKIKTDQQLNFQSNLVWRTIARNLYEKAIEACYEKQDFEEAFYFFEKSRAILLNEQIHEQVGKIKEDIQIETRMKREILDLENKLSQTSFGSEQFIEYQKAVCLAILNLEGFQKRLKERRRNHTGNQPKREMLSLLELKKKILQGSQTLLEVFSGDSAVYILTVSDADNRLLKLGKGNFEKLVHSFNAYVSDPGKANRGFENYRVTANQLYKLIFPVRIMTKRIIISPDGINFPFEALIVSKSADPDYFLRHYAVSYAYSVHYLMNKFAEGKANSMNVFGLAPIKYEPSLKLSGLYGSDQSLENIGKYFSNVNYLIENQATKSNFLENFPSYQIVQLYTHASGNSQHREPVIYFADSILYLSDLLTERNPVTQLVVLSACETGVGKLYEGEGVFSFNRGFASLGIPAAISTLWSVDNQSTYQLTELFYKYLNKGFSTDVALQKAKLAFIDGSPTLEKKLPYFWAGPVLTGKTDVFMKNTSFPWWVVILITVAIVLIWRYKSLMKRFVRGKSWKPTVVT